VYATGGFGVFAVHFRSLAAGLVLAFAALPALASEHLIEPHMRITPGGSTPQVALTLDACMGGADLRILDKLIADEVPATVFVTGRWLRANAAATALMLSHPDLFEIEDHGLNHVPAVTDAQRPYGIAPAGSVAAVTAEVDDGAAMVAKATGHRPTWYRDATALYSPDAIPLIGKLGFHVAGFSLNADFGATASAKVAAKRFASAKDGDVIIAHVNQPKRAAGEGIAAGIDALKAKGFRFVRLEDVAELAD
jgi:peptidoglycan/xylan/chitin deacetylase (PgdA/CDA1 family)